MVIALRRPPEEHLTLRSLQQLHSEQATLQTLAIDSVYSFKDEFDLGLNPLRWSTINSQLGEAPFEFDDEEEQGALVGSTGGNDDADIRLFSRLATWSPGKRCGAQVRFNLPIITTVKFEFGFVQPHLSLDDVDGSDGAVLVKDTPTANMPTFEVACFDTDDNANLSAAAATRNASIEVNDPNNEPAFTAGVNTVLVWANEHGGVTTWLNGRSNASATSQPGPDATSTFGTTNEIVYGSPFLPNAGGYLWFYLQNRAAAPRDVRIDYIQAWQERD